MSPRRELHLDDLARGLGWFSVGLGAAEFLAPGLLQRSLGMRRGRWLLRLYGLRELIAGAGLLLGGNREPWLWARAGGDLLDITTLERLLPRRGRGQRSARAALASVLLVTAVDVLGGSLFSMDRVRRQRRPARDYSDRRGIAKTRAG